MTKQQILECFKKYLSPASSERARLAVYLYAQGRGQDGNKETTGSAEASTEKEQVDSSAKGETAIDEAVEIKDVYVYKTSLAATPGARPVKDLIEYEDTDVVGRGRIEPA